MMLVVHANLDAEATWAGVTLPLAVRRRLAALAPLVTALVDEPVEVWAAVEFDPARLVGSLRPAVRVGVPAAPDLAWAQPGAKHVNDRRFARALVPMPGAHTVSSPAELDAHVATLGPWIAKAPWTAAGRDRHRGVGPLVDAPGRTRVRRLLERFGALVVEPWLDRIVDVGKCGRVDVDGGLVAEPAHGLLVDARGNFVGIDRRPPALEPAEHALLDATLARVGAALHAEGYVGPFAIDAFAYRDGAARRFHPLCEINARYTFGWIAHALDATVLGFGPPPAGASVLIAPAADDPTTAWIVR
ncbi:MAG: hypothetical protein NT062_27855 [Proteobacteria bacterium]|nr:hypothetical protein [Pseudomonadota bacterium]